MESHESLPDQTKNEKRGDSLQMPILEIDRYPEPRIENILISNSGLQMNTHMMQDDSLASNLTGRIQNVRL